MKASIDTSELDKLQIMLKRLPVKVSKRMIKSGLRKSAKILIRAIKSKVPVNEGDLMRSIGSMSGAQRAKSLKRGSAAGAAVKSDNMAIYVGPRRGAKYRHATKRAHLTEFGTRYAGANAFMRPGWDQTKSEVESVIVENIAGAVDNYHKKIKASIR